MSFSVTFWWFSGKKGKIYRDKDIKDYFYTAVLENYTVQGKEYEEVKMPMNGTGATLSGWEMNIQQQLSFLPGPLSGLSLYFNYTRKWKKYWKKF